ncbi:MAG: FCD domain-containing protein [Kiritimatiellales bacterium]
MTAAEQVLNWIETYIEENRLGVGDALPGELDMVAETGISRIPVREALTALKVFGIIQSRRKGGIRIIRDPVTLELRHYFSGQHKIAHHHHDMVEFRAAMELGLGPLTLKRITKTAIKKLRRIVDDIDKKNDQVTVEDFIHAETEFHRTLTEGCGNRLASLLVHIYAPVFKSRWTDSNPLSKRAKAHRETWVKQHKSMVEALEEKDLNRFLTGLRKHMYPYFKIL